MIKNFDSMEVDKAGLDFYNSVIDELLRNGIKPIINLFHFDMPYELESKYGGFLSTIVVDKYVEYAKVCFELFGTKVDRFLTFNEPIAYSRGVFYYDEIYPCTKSANGYIIANHNMLIAHCKAVLEYRKLQLGGEIGIVVDLLPPIKYSDDPKDLYACHIFDLFFNLIYMQPVSLGTLNQDYLDLIKNHDITIDLSSNTIALIKDSIVDFVGVNYYQPVRVKGVDVVDSMELFPWKYYENYKLENARMNEHRGWEIYPEALYEIAMRIKNEFGNIKWYLSENGMGVESEDKFIVNNMIEDDYRIDFISEHLYWLAKAIENGSNCFGYHLWTFTDNWSWRNSFKNRYGLVSYDIDSKALTIKKSGYFYKKMIEDNNTVYNEESYE